MLLCKGKLGNAWGLGGLSKHHSIELEDLFNNVCKISLWNCAVNHGYLAAASPPNSCI